MTGRVFCVLHRLQEDVVVQHRPDLELGQDEPGQNGYPDLLVEGHPVSTGASDAKAGEHSHSMQAGGASVPL